MFSFAQGEMFRRPGSLNFLVSMWQDRWHCKTGTEYRHQPDVIAVAMVTDKQCSQVLFMWAGDSQLPTIQDKDKYRYLTQVWSMKPLKCTYISILLVPPPRTGWGGD